MSIPAENVGFLRSLAACGWDERLLGTHQVLTGHRFAKGRGRPPYPVTLLLGRPALAVETGVMENVASPLEWRLSTNEATNVSPISMNFALHTPLRVARARRGRSAAGSISRWDAELIICGHLPHPP